MKDFGNIDSSNLFDTLAEATAEGRKPRRTYNEAQAQEYMEAGSTTGRKGLKLPRINLAFTPSNYEYIKTMARVRGESLTEFVNAVIEESKEKHEDIYNRAIEFRNSL